MTSSHASGRNRVAAVVATLAVAVSGAGWAGCGGDDDNGDSATDVKESAKEAKQSAKDAKQSAKEGANEAKQSAKEAKEKAQQIQNQY